VNKARWCEVVAAQGAAACGIVGIVLRLTAWPRPPCIAYKIPGDGALISARPAYECDAWLPSTTWDGYLQSGLLLLLAALTAAAFAIALGALLHVRGHDAARFAVWLGTALFAAITLHFGWDIDVTGIAASLLAILASTLALTAPAHGTAGAE
jgi:hypothetical protein